MNLNKTVAVVMMSLMLSQQLPAISLAEERVTKNPPKVEQTAELDIPMVQENKVNTWVWWGLALLVVGGAAAGMGGGGGGGNTSTTSSLNVRW